MQPWKGKNSLQFNSKRAKEIEHKSAWSEHSLKLTQRIDNSSYQQSISSITLIIYEDRNATSKINNTLFVDHNILKTFLAEKKKPSMHATWFVSDEDIYYPILSYPILLIHANRDQSSSWSSRRASSACINISRNKRDIGVSLANQKIFTVIFRVAFRCCNFQISRVRVFRRGAKLISSGGKKSYSWG